MKICKSYNIILVVVYYISHSFGTSFLNINLKIFQGCLIQLINYKNIDLQHVPLTPLITSNYNKNPFNDTYYCDLSSTSKQWFCRAQFFLFPPTETRSNLVYFNNVTNSHMLTLPRGLINYGSHQHPFNERTSRHYQWNPYQTFCILVQSTNCSINSIPKSPWANLFSFYLNQNYYHNFQFHADLLVVLTSTNTINSDISNENIFYLCRFCNPCHPYSPVLLTPYFDFKIIDKFQHYNLSAILNLFKSTKLGYSTPWTITLLSHTWRIAPTFRDNSKFYLHFPPSGIPKEDFVYSNVYLQQALANPLFGNHTYIRTYPKDQSHLNTPICSNNPNFSVLTLPVINYTVVPLTDFMIPLEFSPFRFVSCRGTERYASVISFGSLYKAFDKLTWLAIFTTYFLAMALVQAVVYKLEVGKSSIILKMWFSNFALLLEQGQPYSGRLKGLIYHFILYAPITLASLVMSNAYKGDSIQQLTLARIPKPYETFNELIQDNFTLYYFNPTFWNLPWSLNITFPPMVPKSFEQFLLANVKTVISEWDVPKIVGKCTNNGSAVIIPEQNAYSLADQIRNLSHVDYDDVSIGKEVYSGLWRGLLVLNNVDPEIPQRARRLTEVGIIGEWFKMKCRRVVLLNVPGSEHWAGNEQELKMIAMKKRKKRQWKTSMVLNGNILTLFVLLGIGAMVSGFVFVIELMMITLCFRNRK